MLSAFADGGADGGDPSQAQSCLARLQPPHRLMGHVRLHHRSAEGANVVAKLLRLMQAQERGGRRGMELELLDAIGLLQRREGLGEQRQQSFAVPLGHGLTDRRQRGGQSGQSLGSGGRIPQSTGETFVMAVQLAGLAFIHQPIEIGGKHQRHHRRCDQSDEGQSRGHLRADTPRPHAIPSRTFKGFYIRNIADSRHGRSIAIFP